MDMSELNPSVIPVFLQSMEMAGWAVSLMGCEGFQANPNGSAVHASTRAIVQTHERDMTFAQIQDEETMTPS